MIKEDRFRLDYSYHGVPEHTRESLENYFFHGYEPGSFVVAVLSNDLYGACTRGDHVNKEYIVEIVKWVIHCAPHGSYGSLATVHAWIKDVDGRRTEFVEAWEKKEMWRVLNEQ